MSAICLRIPNSLHRHMKDIAKNDGVSINQFISSAVSEKVSALTVQEYFEVRAKRSSRSRFERALSRIPHTTPDANDKF